METGITKVISSGGWYFKKDGVQIGTDKFKFAYDFKDGFAAVQYDDDLWGYVNEQMIPIGKERFLRVELTFKSKYAIVKRQNEKCNYIGKNGRMLLENDVDETYSIVDGIGMIGKKDGDSNIKYNMIIVNETQGTATKLFKEWFNKIEPFRGKDTTIAKRLNNSTCILRKDGTIKDL